MINKLFDEDESLDNLPPEECEESHSRNFSHDKIFENNYNTGNLDFEEYTTLPKVESFYAETNLQDCYDSYEYYRKQELEKKIDEYFNLSEFSSQFVNKKKLPKQVLAQVFVSIKEQFIDNAFTGSEIFIAISDYFGINYETLYENIPSVYRAELIKELDEKYGILKHRGVKRLF